ncbi:uncharacterized protein YheU (UPF0270 family) [Dysgonomonas sp. PH5-45]|uniref:hypothetical protein n=1 Tax=unclassified Dysgonomonas TaxID=2630389 RepID=UPI002475DF3B|nr:MULTISPECIES: hypothetical protein [unclassified Dysgonomonas]MDH6354493.1 uncharacterized protein YheU (UPF0270 family) [Dysgonomonas sp. PH5-45]MDH6387450.1 uncharacterized protein YheU (UPF0270 family) [Dysgonomonas sp. PH5-37]
MGYCDGILEKDIEVTCEDLVVKGIEANGVIINRKDIKFSEVAFNNDNKNIIEKLTLNEGTKGYKIYVPTPTPFSGTTTTMEEGTNRKTFTNNLGFVILDNGPEVAQIIDALATGEFVVVYENKYKGLQKTTSPGAATYQIVGYYQGLKASTLENDKYSDDTEGGWNVVLTETKVPKSALFLYAGSAEASTAAFKTLLDEAQA